MEFGAKGEALGRVLRGKEVEIGYVLDFVRGSIDGIGQFTKDS